MCRVLSQLVLSLYSNSLCRCPTGSKPVLATTSISQRQKLCWSAPAPVPCRPAPAATCSVCSSWSNSGAPGTSGQSGSSSSDPAAAGPMCRPHPGPGSGPAAPAPAPGSAVPKVAPGPDCHSRLPGLLAGRLRLPQRQKLHYPFSGKLRGAAVVGSGLVVNCPEGEHQSVRSFPFSLLGG